MPIDVNYGKINPPSFYEKDEQPTEKDLAREEWKDAKHKIEVIKKSESIVYNVIGGGIQRDKDIEEAEIEEQRLYDIYTNL
jgi:hypothetical protein